MKANNGLSSNQLKIINICEEFYKNEFFYKNFVKNQEYYGYLIENKIIDKIKTKINYEKIKPFVDKKEYEKCRKEIKDIEIKLEELTPKQYKKSKELMSELLNDNKSFYLIKQGYFSKIIDNSKLTGKEIHFKFNKDDTLIFIFSQNDNLTFTNNKSGVIDKSILLNNTKNINVNSKEKVGFPTPEGPSQNVKNDLEILVRIFYYNKYLTEKENESFKELKKEENSETVYLIHNSWMEEYKSFFDYQYLENYLKNKKEYSDKFIQNNYNLSTETINDIIKNLPNEYINKINTKNQFDKNKTFTYEFNQNKNGINYLCNNHIINSNIYQLLEESKYKLKDVIKTFDLYFVGSKKMLLLSNEKGSNKDSDEIGSINDKGIFIPEYILNYAENNSISLDILNKFFKNDFFNLLVNKEVDNLEIKNDEKKIGQCFKLNNNILYNNFVSPKPGNKDSNTTTDKGNTNTSTNKQTNISTNDQLNKKSEDTITKEINPYIELMINTLLFIKIVFLFF